MRTTGGRRRGAYGRKTAAVAAYEHRAPHPTEVFDVLVGLIADEPATVLDLGAGDGAIARPLAARSVTEVVGPYSVDGTLELPVVATVRWGRPVAH